MQHITTWRQLILKEMQRAKDPGPLVVCTLTEDELDTEFDSGFGRIEGNPFTAWTERRVYFPVGFDGAEYVGSAPRRPCEEATKHVGGYKE